MCIETMSRIVYNIRDIMKGGCGCGQWIYAGNTSADSCCWELMSMHKNALKCIICINIRRLDMQHCCFRECLFVDALPDGWPLLDVIRQLAAVWSDMTVCYCLCLAVARCDVRRRLAGVWCYEMAALSFDGWWPHQWKISWLWHAALWCAACPFYVTV